MRHEGSTRETAAGAKPVTGTPGAQLVPYSCDGIPTGCSYRVADERPTAMAMRSAGGVVYPRERAELAAIRMTATISPPPTTALRALGVGLATLWLGFATRLFYLREADLMALHVLGYALVVAVAIGVVRPLARAVSAASERVDDRVFVPVSALIAVAISSVLVRRGLDGKVFAIDAAVYLAQARALAHGHFGMPIPAPLLSFGGHFLLEGADGRLHGIFPPGYPLFLVPFVAMDRAMLAGPAVAALLVFAQHALGRALGVDPVTRRVAIVLTLPSFARAMETADLLSHAWTAVLVALAGVFALRLARGGGWRTALALGATLGWCGATRLLDGLVIGVACALWVAGAFVRQRRRVGLVPLWVVLAAAPWMAFVGAHQRAVTGSWTTPTQYAYFQRSDWPPSCHRLGFGRDVGCSVEHEHEREAFGADGYQLDDAARVTRTRAEQLGVDAVGLGLLLLLAVIVLAVRPTWHGVLCGSITASFTLAYGLFYYGNAPFYGARHLFPCVPFVAILVADLTRVAPTPVQRWLAPAHARGIAIVILVAIAMLGGHARWTPYLRALQRRQAPRVDLHAFFAVHHLDRGLVITRDERGALADFDSVWGEGRRLVAVDDRAGSLDVRRSHADLPLYFALPGGQLAEPQMAPPPPGFAVELASAWPAFVYPNGLAARRADSRSCCGVTLAGGDVLQVTHGVAGGTLEVPFWVPQHGRYRVHLEGMTGEGFGDFDVAIDGARRFTWLGDAATPALAESEPVSIAFEPGRHALQFRLTGREARRTGSLGAFVALVGVPDES